MPQNNGLREMLTPPASREMWVASIAASVASATFGVILLAGGDWIPGGIIVATVIFAWASRIPGIWQRHHGRAGHSPPPGEP